jgi:hypothetical protein
MKKNSIILLASIFCFQQTQSRHIIVVSPAPVYYSDPVGEIACVAFAGSFIAGVSGLIDLCDNSERSDAHTTSNGIIKLTGACALAALGALLLKSA